MVIKKSKLQKHKPTKGKPKQQQSLISKMKFGWKIIVGISVLLAFLCAYYAFSSKVSVYPYSSLDPLDPFKIPFIIENKSYLPIHNVIFSCVVRKIESSGSDILIMNFNIKYDSPAIPYITSGEKTKTFCSNPFKPLTPITSADIEVMVSYRPSFIPWQKQKSTRFSTIKDVKGNLIWLPKAITEKN